MTHNVEENLRNGIIAKVVCKKIFLHISAPASWNEQFSSSFSRQAWLSGCLITLVFGLIVLSHVRYQFLNIAHQALTDSTLNKVLPTTLCPSEPFVQHSVPRTSTNPTTTGRCRPFPTQLNTWTTIHHLSPSHLKFDRIYHGSENAECPFLSGGLKGIIPAQVGSKNSSYDDIAIQISASFRWTDQPRWLSRGYLVELTQARDS